jgi:hypothetical protein
MAAYIAAILRLDIECGALYFAGPASCPTNCPARFALDQAAGPPGWRVVPGIVRAANRSASGWRGHRAAAEGTGSVLGSEQPHGGKHV